VTFKKHRYDKEKVTGEVTMVLEDEATYLVFSEELGHVRRVDRGSGTTGIYVPYESAEEVT
jgi:oxalate decarboxylase/phosphoglucose isomerase-like protein (cupin superfamily)